MMVDSSRPSPAAIGTTELDLAAVCPGFQDPVHDAQRSFRALLNAMAQPGTIVQIGTAPPLEWSAAAWALAMTLLDSDTRIWLSPTLATPVARASLQFHTSCPITTNAAEADFVFVGHPDEQPAWSTLRHGQAEFPDQSATMILQIPGCHHPIPTDVSLQTSPTARLTRWELSGPGIEHSCHIALHSGPGDWPERLRAALALNQTGFPLGVDLLLAWADHLCALPRTTRIATI